MRMWLQLTGTLGAHAWVGRTTESLDRDLAREKKAAQRAGTQLLYCIVGDLIVSNTQISDSQRFMELKGWRKRITETYMFALNRMRRSRVFGRMSRVTPKRQRANRDNWVIRFFTLAEIVAESRDKHADEQGWHVWEDERGNLKTTLSV